MSAGARWKQAQTIALAFVAITALQGCAATRSTTKEEEPRGLSVRLPITDMSTLNIESQPSLGRPELPLSVSDESRGRWLTFFQVNYSPAKPPAPLPIPEEKPSR
jgi:hypothetical protein